MGSGYGSHTSFVKMRASFAVEMRFDSRHLHFFYFFAAAGIAGMAIFGFCLIAQNEIFSAHPSVI